MQGNLRKWLALLLAIAAYYVVHEGAHAIAALQFGVFERIQLLIPGVQVVIDADALTDAQLLLFSASGAAATLASALLLMALAPRITRSSSKMLRAFGFYATIVLLLADPIYLALLSGLFGGGDLNGLLLSGLPETALRLLFAAIGILGAVIFIKKVYPGYKASFS